jgi:hypothetical protein
MNPTQSAILKRHDARQDAATIAAALSVSLSYVYSTLREHRPNRKRKSHPKRSDLPRMITGLHDQGIAQSRIAVVLGVSRQYVSRVLAS